MRTYQSALGESDFKQTFICAAPARAEDGKQMWWPAWWEIKLCEFHFLNLYSLLMSENPLTEQLKPHLCCVMFISCLAVPPPLLSLLVPVLLFPHVILTISYPGHLHVSQAFSFASFSRPPWPFSLWLQICSPYLSLILSTQNRQQGICCYSEAMFGDVWGGRYHFRWVQKNCRTCWGLHISDICRRLVHPFSPLIKGSEI